MTDDSMTSGGGGPHVRKTTSRTGSSSNISSSHIDGTVGGSGSSHNNTVMDSLSIEPGNAEPSTTATSHTNLMGPSSSLLSQPPSQPSNTTVHNHTTPSLLSHPPSSLRSSSSLYQNQHHPYSYTTSTMDWYRFYDIRSMDIQSALDQMKTLLSVWNHGYGGSSSSSGGSKSQTMMIYKLAYYRKQTKNHWYRDDPTFILLQILMLLIACITYSIAFKISILHSISFILTSILFNYLAIGVVMTSILREFTNRHLLTHHHHHPTAGSTSTAATTHIQKQQVEWLYAFDIHCNSFFPLFIVLCKYSCVLWKLSKSIIFGTIVRSIIVAHSTFVRCILGFSLIFTCISLFVDVAQFFTLPITLGEGYIPLIIANTLYAVGFCWYWYITHLGYRALPFLSHTEIFLFPITIILLFYLLMIIGYPFGLGYNMTRVMARFYFM